MPCWAPLVYFQLSIILNLGSADSCTHTSLSIACICKNIPNANALVSLTTSIFSLDGWCGLVRPTNHLATCWDIKRYAKIHISLFSLLLFHVSVIKCLTFLDRMNSLCTNDVRCMFSTSSSPILCYSSLTQHNLRASFRSSMFSVIISRSVRNDRVSSKRTEGLNTTSSCDSGADQG